MSATGQQPPGNVISPAPEPAQVEVTRYQCPKPGCETISESERGIRQHATRMHGDHWTKLTVACLHCGGTFYAKPDRRETARYCSHDCREGPHSTGDPDILSEPVGAVEAKISRFQCPVEGCDRLFETEKGTQRHIAETHPEHRGVTLECERCGGVFQRKASASSYARFCSEECRDRSRRRRVTLSCEFCGEEFWTHECREEIARFCSLACKYASRTLPRKTMNCSWCGKQIERLEVDEYDDRFCDKQCLIEWLLVEHESQPTPDISDCSPEDLGLSPFGEFTPRSIFPYERGYTAEEIRSGALVSDNVTYGDCRTWRQAVRSLNEIEPVATEADVPADVVRDHVSGDCEHGFDVGDAVPLRYNGIDWVPMEFGTSPSMSIPRKAPTFDG
jgi:uncharacterized C2H2 Zn-finger protein